MPKAIFLVDSEIWPNLILEINKNKIPLALINARITNKSFKRWNFFQELQKIFNRINLSLTSNEETKEYLYKFNVKNVHHYGNIKLANKIKTNLKNLNKKILNDNKFWFAVAPIMEKKFYVLKSI